MKKHFENTAMLYTTAVLVLLKVFFACFCLLYIPFLSAAFPSVLYIYIFIFSLFSNNFNAALQCLPFMIVGASLPSVSAVLVLRTNRKGAGLASFFLVLLCLADILFILVHPLNYRWPFIAGAILLNLAIILPIILMHKLPAGKNKT